MRSSPAACCCGRPSAGGRRRRLGRRCGAADQPRRAVVDRTSASRRIRGRPRRRRAQRAARRSSSSAGRAAEEQDACRWSSSARPAARAPRAAHVRKLGLREGRGPGRRPRAWQRGQPAGRETNRAEPMQPVKMYTTAVCPYCHPRQADPVKPRGVESIEEIRDRSTTPRSATKMMAAHRPPHGAADLHRRDPRRRLRRAGRARPPRRPGAAAEARAEPRTAVARPSDAATAGDRLPIAASPRAPAACSFDINKGISHGRRQQPDPVFQIQRIYLKDCRWSSRIRRRSCSSRSSRRSTSSSASGASRRRRHLRGRR